MNSRRSFFGKFAAMVATGFGIRAAERQTILHYDIVHDPDHYVAGAYTIPEGTAVFFNGENWNFRTCECHTREGWLIAYDSMDPNTITPVKRKHFGKVEIRND